MISIPIAVVNSLFKWQLDLFWFAHKKIYNQAAAKKAFAVVINRDFFVHPISKSIDDWNNNVPHQMCDSFYDYLGVNEHQHFGTPMNIQCGVLQVIDNIDDEEVVEILDCDMFHLKQHPELHINDDELFVCDIYEDWHLKSLSNHKWLIEEYFLNDGKYYNGGFVPIVGKAKTFKKILREWLDLHVDILKKTNTDHLKWWAGMYALNAVCERNQITMIAKDFCYIPGINELSENHYICHYSADSRFNKKTFPRIDRTTFLNNFYYDTVNEWLTLYMRDSNDI